MRPARQPCSLGGAGEGVSQTEMAAPTIVSETSLNTEVRKSAFPCFVRWNSSFFEEIARYASNKIDQGKVKAIAPCFSHTVNANIHLEPRQIW